jgi:predicted DNA-binding antitoxin AbrB/MazE fold protein
MTITIEAIFDGKVFHPVAPISIKPDTRVKIVVENESGTPSVSCLDVAENLRLDGPPDWSAKLDEYLYGGRTFSGE